MASCTYPTLAEKHKTRKKFSAMALDQCHEQNNAMVKGSVGLIRLTGNPGACRRWMVAGPEIARITTEFEEQAILQQNNAGNTGHHHLDQQPTVQTAFLKEVRALVTVLEEMGNSFLAARTYWSLTQGTSWTPKSQKLREGLRTLARSSTLSL